MRTVGVIIALAGALALQTTLAGLTIGSATAVNLVLVAVIYVALAFGPVAGLLAGSAGGLVQDALAGGIVGIGFFDDVYNTIAGLFGPSKAPEPNFPKVVTISGEKVSVDAPNAITGTIDSGRVATVTSPAPARSAASPASAAAPVFPQLPATTSTWP